MALVISGPRARLQDHVSSLHNENLQLRGTGSREDLAAKVLGYLRGHSANYPNEDRTDAKSLPDWDFR